MPSADRLISLARTAIRPERACIASLGVDPIPLYSDALDVALLWNAKAGCTFAIKWLFYQEGLLDEALTYSRWPHDYRQDVYCRRPSYVDKLARLPTMGSRAIKFVRDPHHRAVGGYLFYADWAQRQREPQHVEMLTDIGNHLGRTVVSGEPFTFREFVGFLGTSDLDSADVHVRRQISTCERLGQLPDLTVVRIEDSASRLPRLEDELGLRRSDLDRLGSSMHHTRRDDVAGFVGDHLFARTLGVTVPRTAAFYDESLKAEVSRLYAEDLEAYGYPA